MEKAEELVGMAKEYLPHQLTGAETDSTATGGAYRGGAYTGSATTAGMYARVSTVLTQFTAVSCSCVLDLPFKVQLIINQPDQQPGQILVLNNPANLTKNLRTIDH